MEQLLAEDAWVGVIELDEASLGWVAEHPAGARVIPVVGDAADDAVTDRAAEAVEAVAPSSAG